jgi:hypothetical protein
MDTIRIEGVPQYDGEYPIDVSTLTMRELHQMKQLTGLRLFEFDSALAAGDLDVIVGLAVVSLQRAGKTVDADLIWDAELGAVSLIVGDDDGPPAASPNEPHSDDQTSSGDASSSDSDSPETTPPGTGTQE